MMTKYLQKKIDAVTDEHIYGIGNRINLEYYMTESNIGKFDELSGSKVYGIEIISKSEDACMESEVISNFSCCREKTKLVLDKLADNWVTPMELQYILDDILGT